ncbi:MAG: NTP transferase domain-containing protein, partial [Nakamurella sp.]
MTVQAPRPRVAGLLLAAGAGQRYGGPKALVDTGSGPWVQRGLEILAGCEPLLVVIGASSAEVAALVPGGVRVVHNSSFTQGMGSSLRAGLVALAELPGQGAADGVAQHEAESAGSVDGPAGAEAVAADRQAGAAVGTVAAAVGAGQVGAAPEL